MEPMRFYIRTLCTTGHSIHQSYSYTIGMGPTIGLTYFIYTIAAHIYFSDPQLTTRSVRSGMWRLVETSSPGVERLVET